MPSCFAPLFIHATAAGHDRGADVRFACALGRALVAGAGAQISRHWRRGHTCASQGRAPVVDTACLVFQVCTVEAVLVSVAGAGRDRGSEQ